MKDLVDVHVVLATNEDMEYWEDKAEEATEKLNMILHMLYDAAEEDIETERLEKLLHHVWENWREDSHLLDIDDDDLRDWVDHLLSTWEDEQL